MPNAGLVDALKDSCGTHDDFPKGIQLDLEGQILKAGVFTDLLPVHELADVVCVNIDPELGFTIRSCMVKKYI